MENGERRDPFEWPLFKLRIGQGHRGSGLAALRLYGRELAISSSDARPTHYLASQIARAG